MNVEKILEKISQYEIWNNIIPGIALCLIFKYLINVDWLNGTVLEQFFVVYLVGIVNGRVGSIVIEPFFKKISDVRKYELFVKAEKLDEKITKISAINNKYRALASVAFISLISYLVLKFNWNADWCASLKPAIVLFSLFILFALSYRKQTSYVSKRVDCALNGKAGGGSV